MVRSTWNDWFVREEVEAAEPDGLSIWFLGCNGFILRTATTTLYIDPFFGTGQHRPYAIRMIPVPMDPENATLCDGVFVTHEHVDHMHPPSHAPLLDDEDTMLYAPETSYSDHDYNGEISVPESQQTVVEIGDTFVVGDLTVHVFDANDPDAKEPVSYVVEHESGTFYHAGDSRYTDTFKKVGSAFDVNVSAIAFGTCGRFLDGDTGKPRTACNYMHGNDVVKSANALSTDRLVPTHHEFWKGWHADPKALHEHATTYSYPRSIEMMKLGDRIDIQEYGIVPSRYTQAPD